MARDLRNRLGSCFRGRARQAKTTELQPSATPPRRSAAGRRDRDSSAVAPGLPQLPSGSRSVGKKKAAGARLWMRFSKSGESELAEYDRSAIIGLTSIPARDLRVLGPVFSHSANILGREKAMVVNLEFIKLIITSEELLLLDPLSIEVIPFVDRLKNQVPPKAQLAASEPDLAVLEGRELDCPVGAQLDSYNEPAEEEHVELPFEFQVLEIALEVVCAHLHSSVADLERDAYPALDELTKNVSKMNLELVRNLKGNLTRLLARTQKVRDEIEHLLDDDEDMAQLYMTRKKNENIQFEALIAAAGGSDGAITRHTSNTYGSMGTTSYVYSNDRDVEDLEMLLESYFMQLDAARNKILSVREYIDDTEDYVNIQLDQQRNELIQLHLVLTMFGLCVSFEMFVFGAFSMNVPCSLYQMEHVFTTFVSSVSSASFVVFLLMLGYARWKKLIGS